MAGKLAPLRVVIVGLSIGSSISCARSPAAGPGVALGGETTVHDGTRNAYSLPARNLREEHRTAFFVGNSFFNKNWVSAPSSVTDRDGLGPLFNARSCSACHVRDGRGRPPDPGGVFTSMILRVAGPAAGGTGPPRPDPIYGDQIQGQALPGLAHEADVELHVEAVSGTYGDGEPFQLRRPRLRITSPGHGPPAPGLSTSARVAPAVIGLGLLEAVPEAVLRAMADPDDRDGDGVSGRLSLVLDRETGQRRPGRFGWKAEQPTVLQQVAAAFNRDLGLTSSLFPDENHTPAQKPCVGRASGGRPEVEDHLLRAVATYARALAVPARRRFSAPEVVAGQRLFFQARCDACHRVSIETGEQSGWPELSRQKIHPFSDLLLHDMGEELADAGPTGSAGAREWRTAPLWGLGLLATVNQHTFLLHDGRARDVAEAILWHGGEGHAAREAFRTLSRAQRRALLAFLDSL